MGDESKNQSNKSIKEDDEAEEDQGWQKVRHRKPQNGNIASGSYAEACGFDGKAKKTPKIKLNLLERMSMSFYITNFPSHVTAKDLWNRCLNWGMVVDVFIPNRLSKAGRRFGFVRYIKVDNAARLLTDLKSMWFGNYLVFADVVKYSRYTGLRKTEIPNQQSEYVKKDPKSMSYVDVLSGVKDSVKEASNSFPFSGNIPLSSTSTRCVKLSCQDCDISDTKNFSLLVKIKDPENITKAAQWLFDEGFSDFKVSYVGGRWLLFTFGSREVKDLFLANQFLKGRFCVFKTPCNFFVPDERLVWVELSGLPLGAWKIDSLRSILGKWGKCVFFANEWENGFPMCKVCVLVQSSKFVFEELQVSLNDKPYVVWIKEVARWEPKFLKPSHDSSSSHELPEDDESFIKNWWGDDEGTPSEQFDSQLCHSNSEESKGELLAEFDNQFPKDSHGDVTSCVNVNAPHPEHHDISESNNVNDIENSLGDNVENKSEIPFVDPSGRFNNEAETMVDCNNVTVNEDQSANHNNGLDDYDVFLLNRLLHQDMRGVRPDKVVANEKLKVSNDFSLKQDQIDEVIGNGKQKQVVKQMGEQLSSSVVSPSTPPATNLNTVDESSSTWLDYIGPLTADDLDSEKCWSYKDPSGNVQGPFSLAQLNEWKDYFHRDFTIWRYYGNVKDTILLRSALKRRTKDVG